MSAYMKVAPALLVILMLGACGLSNGQCKIPATEAEIHRSLVLTLLKMDFNSQHIVHMSASEYLAANPECCSVTPLNVSPLQRLVWDRYSLPKYRVETAVAYRDGPTTIEYSRHGNGDSCGRVPDDYGWSEIVAGPVPRDSCPLNDTERAKASRDPLICEARPRSSLTAVPIVEARRLYREKLARTVPIGEVRP